MSNPTTKPLLISVVGPTAVGKTSLAIKLALHYRTEIISADSRQLFREMTIGTAKSDQNELDLVNHHFINSHSIEEDYSAGMYERDAVRLIGELSDEHKVLIAVGGSTLYLKALWEGFDDMPKIDPEVRKKLNEEFDREGLSILLQELKENDPTYYNQVDKNNGQRVIRALEVIRTTGKPFSSFRKEVKKELPYENLKIGISMDREALFDRINLRMDKMIDEGLFDEAKSLIEYKNHNALQTVGYSEIFNYLDGQYNKDEAIRLLKRNSRRYAKRQMTWFRRYEDIHWFESTQEDEILKLIDSYLH